jgi:hypothetical protein
MRFSKLFACAFSAAVVLSSSVHASIIDRLDQVGGAGGQVGSGGGGGTDLEHAEAVSYFPEDVPTPTGPTAPTPPPQPLSVAQYEEFPETLPHLPPESTFPTPTPRPA